MRAHSIRRWQHEHVFLGSAHTRNERRLWWVVGLTLAMMIGEIVAGTIYESMALLADGWHMATHAGALSISAAAYGFARSRARDARYVFGTGKVGDLAGFTSAVILVGVAGIVGYESCARLVHPAHVHFDQAIVVAVIGLVVNIASAFVLDPHDGARSADEHAQAAGAGHAAHHDHNLRSAHLHVLADALTSVFAILALCAGKLLDWTWTDPVCGVVGALFILRWSFALLRDTGAILLDVEPDPQLSARIQAEIERDEADRVSDLHVWRIGPGNFAAIISIVSAAPRAPDHYKGLLRGIPHLAHLTVEVHACAQDPVESAAATPGVRPGP